MITKKESIGSVQPILRKMYLNEVLTWPDAAKVGRSDGLWRDRCGRAVAGWPSGLHVSLKVEKLMVRFYPWPELFASCQIVQIRTETTETNDSSENRNELSDLDLELTQ